MHPSPRQVVRVPMDRREHDSVTSPTISKHLPTSKAPGPSLRTPAATSKRPASHATPLTQAQHEQQPQDGETSTCIASIIENRAKEARPLPDHQVQLRICRPTTCCTRPSAVARHSGRTAGMTGGDGGDGPAADAAIAGTAGGDVAQLHQHFVGFSCTVRHLAWQLSFARTHSMIICQGKAP